MGYDENLVDRVREHLRAEAGLTEKRMFGGLAFMINGHMAVSASSKGGLLLRVDSAQTAELLADPHARRFEMRGRELAGWLRIDIDPATADDELADWVRLGVNYARSLPPKS